MARRYHVGFSYPRDKVSKEQIEFLENTFKSFDYDFPSLSCETSWRRPQCGLVDILDFCAFVTGQEFKGWLSPDEEYSYYSGEPAAHLTAERTEYCSSTDRWYTSIPALPKGKTGKEFVWNWLTNIPAYINQDDYDLCCKMIKVAFGEETLIKYQTAIFKDENDCYFIEPDEISDLFHKLVYPD